MLRLKGSKWAAADLTKPWIRWRSSSHARSLSLYIYIFTQTDIWRNMWKTNLGNNYGTLKWQAAHPRNLLSCWSHCADITSPRNMNSPSFAFSEVSSRFIFNTALKTDAWKRDAFCFECVSKLATLLPKVPWLIWAKFHANQVRY